MQAMSADAIRIYCRKLNQPPICDALGHLEESVSRRPLNDLPAYLRYANFERGFLVVPGQWRSLRPGSIAGSFSSI